MSWGKLDDRYDDNVKIKRAWKRNRAAIGLHAMAITYCSRHETDGVVDVEWIEEKLPAAGERRKVIDALLTIGLFEIVDHEHYRVHDFLEFNPAKADRDSTREWDRRRKELFRDPELVQAIRDRDADRCRYCGVLVNWKDRRGSGGGTYDHVEPRGANTMENVVVACRGCNSAKGGRTSAEARMPLLEAGLKGKSEGRLGLVAIQNGSSSELGDDLATRPVPSPPDSKKHPTEGGAFNESDRPRAATLPNGVIL